MVPIDDAILEKSHELYDKYRDKTWSLVDCISFVVMRERAVTDVLTFDADFAAAGFIVVKE